MAVSGGIAAVFVLGVYAVSITVLATKLVLAHRRSLLGWLVASWIMVFVAGICISFLL